MSKWVKHCVIGAGAAAVLAAALVACLEIVPVGHVKVSTLFGDVKRTYGPGLHFPVNPLLSWHAYDVRAKEHTETINVPTQDQLVSTIDVTIQGNVSPELAHRLLAETGRVAELVAVHIKPKVRSIVR